jgi:hypothetical protein
MDSLPAGLAKKPWPWLCAICAVVVAAQLSVLPVQIYYFQKISTLVLPANILAEPLVAPITVMGFASSLISAAGISCSWSAIGQGGAVFPSYWLIQMLLQFGSMIDYLCGYLIDLLLWLTDFLGRLPFSYLYLARPQPMAVVFYYLTLVVAFLLGLNKPARGVALAMVAGSGLIFYCFLNSSCLEVLVARDRVLIGRPFDPPILFQVRSDSSALANNRYDANARGYLPNFHRDFMQSYLRSINSSSCCQMVLTSTDCCAIEMAGTKLVAVTKKQPLQTPYIVGLAIKAGQPKLSSPLPDSATELESCQGVKFFRYRTWGLLASLAGKFLSLLVLHL